MKLASRKHGRDGSLLVVSRNLERAADASAIAPTMQAALDDFETALPELEKLAAQLETNAVESFEFDAQDCAAPLPRAYQWIDGSAYVNHVELLRRSRNKPLPDSFWTTPLLYQGGSDDLLGPRDPIPFGNTGFGVDFEAELAVITDDVPMGVSPQSATQHIKLFMLANDVSLRRLIPEELAMGFGFFVGKPSTAFSPVAVTPAELGDNGEDAVLNLEMTVRLNGEAFGKACIGVDRVFTFADLIAHAASTRNLRAGTILGGGTVSNKLGDGPGRPIREGGAGYSCIAEQRAVETITHGRPSTPWLETGDRVEIEMRYEGQSVFGTIDQTVTEFPPGARPQSDPV